MKKSVVAVATKSSSALLFLRGKGKSLPAALSVLPQSICNTQGSYSNRIHGVRSVLKASGWQRALYTSCTGSVCWHSTSHPGSDDALPQEWAKFSAYMRHDGFSELCEKMYTEMVQLEENEESLIPLKVRGFEYTLLPEDGYQSVYRVPQNSSMVEPERIIYTKDLLEHLHGDRVDIEALKISYSGDQIMLLVRTDDGDSHVFIRDMKDKRTVIQSHIRNAMNVEFDRDGRVYFTVPGRTGVPSSVMVADAIQSSTNEASAELPRCVFNDDDPKNFVGLQRTKDWEYLCINSNSKISSEVYIIDGIHDDVVCIQERMPGIEYAVEHCQGHLILLSNHGDGLDPHIYTAKVDRAVSGRISVGEWHKAYSPQAGSFIIDMTVHQHGITVIEKSFPAIPSVKVLPIETTFSDVLALNSPYTLPLPEWVMDVQFGCNEEYQSPCVELELQSPIIPSIHVEWNLLSKQINEVSRHRDEYFTRDLEHKLGHYSATRVPLKFKDGLSIPLTLVYRNDVTNPSKCLFIAYGAYGDTLDMSHQTFLFPLLDRGWKVFFVHCRGGGEMGKAWYQSGRVPNKKCTEIDLRACIKTMIDNGTVLSKYIHYSNKYESDLIIIT
jgi:oligopeptidase B